MKTCALIRTVSVRQLKLAVRTNIFYGKIRRIILKLSLLIWSSVRVIMNTAYSQTILPIKCLFLR